MSIVSEIRLTVAKNINLGNYENVKIEGTVVVGANDDKDTPESMRDQALDEVANLLDAARKDHVPERRRNPREENLGRRVTDNEY